ncbi:MAG TPA: hypothetical protein VF661_01675, partial [Actinomycetales bacterium]
MLAVAATLLTGVAEVAAAAPLPGPGTVVEAERLALPAGSGQQFADTSATGGAGLLIWSNAAATGTLTTTTRSDRLALSVRGDQCAGAPAMTVRVDGVQVLATTVANSDWTTLTVP